MDLSELHTILPVSWQCPGRILQRLETSWAPVRQLKKLIPCLVLRHGPPSAP